MKALSLPKANASMVDRFQVPGDPTFAVVTVAVLGCGAVLMLAGAASTNLELTVGGAVATAAALLVLVAAGWLHGLALVALSLPLPALYSTMDVRFAPVLAVTALAVVGWLVRRAVDASRIDLGSLPRRATLAVLAAVALAAAFAQEKGPAARELVNLGLMVALLFAATNDLVREPGWTRRLVWILVCLTGVTGLLATAQAGGFLPSRFPLAGTACYRATVGFGWPNELGMFMALGVPLCVHASGTARGQVARVVAYVCLTASVLGLAATFSRGSWLALTVSTLALLVTGQFRFVLKVWVAALVALVLTQSVLCGAVSGRITSGVGGSYIDQRAALTLAGLLMLLANPLVGVGPGGFAHALDQFGASVSWLWDYVGSAHNAYVHMAAETGLIGLIALVSFLGSGLFILLRSARRAHIDPDVSPEEVSLRRALLWSFATACALGMVEWLFAHGIGQLVMLVAAMGFARQRHQAG